MSYSYCRAGLVFLALACIGSAPQAATSSERAVRHHSLKTATKPAPTVAKKPALDRSGEARRGQASYYGGKFKGRKMADGSRMNPSANSAASKTLPLGTVARVTNLKSGKSAVVTIRDRGPHVANRIVDVTPKVAGQLDMKENGVAPVVVKPIAVPQADGSVRSGVGATDHGK